MQRKRSKEAWQDLDLGAWVTVSEPGRPIYIAMIDAKTEDSQVIWIITESGIRRAFDAREEIQLFPGAERSVRIPCPLELALRRDVPMN